MPNQVGMTCLVRRLEQYVFSLNRQIRSKHMKLLAKIYLVSCPRNSYANFWDKQATKILIFLVSTLNLKSNGFQIRDTRVGA